MAERDYLNFNGLSRFFDKLKQYIKKHRSNWNENNPDEIGYIDNRTHYIDGNGNVVKIDSSFLPFASSTNAGTIKLPSKYGSVNQSTGEINLKSMQYKKRVVVESDLPNNAKEGDVYKIVSSGKIIVFNGSQWEVIADNAFSHSDDDNSAVLTGLDNTATQPGTTLLGSNLQSDSANQTVIGKYNVNDDSNSYAFIIGGGSEDNRKNISSVDWSGNASFNSIILTASDDASVKVKITVDSSGNISTTVL